MAKPTIKILFILLFISFSAAFSQKIQQTGRGMSQDSLKIISSPGENTASSSDTSVYVMHKSPWGAVLRSAAIPGWGQLYNHSYWKIPVVWGFIGYFSYVWISQNNYYRDYINYVNTSNIPGTLYYGRPEQARSDMNFYRDQRDLFAIYFGLTYALNLLDAYVDAQLFDFSVEEDSFTNSPRLSVKFHF